MLTLSEEDYDCRIKKSICQMRHNVIFKMKKKDV